MLIEENPGEKEELALTPGADDQVSKDEGAAETPSPKSETPAKDGDETPAGKSYTQEEVNEIMHARTKDYASMKRDLDMYRAFVSEQKERAQKAPAPIAPQAPAASELDEDDKKFVDYLKKVIPGIDRLGKLDEKQLGFLSGLQQREEAEQAKFTESSEQKVNDFCDSISAKDDAQRAVIRDAVAAAILNDPKLYEMWVNRDGNVVADAVKVLETTLGRRSEVANKQDLSAIKAKVEKIQAPLPKGGVPAPISKPKTVSDDERVDKAWDALSKK